MFHLNNYLNAVLGRYMDAYISRCPYLSASDFMAPCFEDKSGRTFFGAPVREAISSALSVLDVRSRSTSRRTPAVYRSLLPADDVTRLLSFHYKYSTVQGSLYLFYGQYTKNCIQVLAMP